MEYPFLKKHFCIIKIWNASSKVQDAGVLNNELSEFLNISEVKYSEHVKNIERDAIKVNKYRERMKERESRVKHVVVFEDQGEAI